jgi:isoquinoline 1-oxidoreductase beta subunit
MPDKVQLTDPKDFKLIGKPLRRVDSADKVKGATQFGLDVRVPGMKIAVVKACPTFDGKLASVDDKAARAMPGVVDVIRIADAVAVVGDHFWAAKQGLEALADQMGPRRERQPHHPAASRRTRGECAQRQVDRCARGR